MNKEQNPTTLKLRKVDGDRIVSNHNETALKVHKSGDGMIPEETELKVRKGTRVNYNQTMLKVRKGIPLNHNETALRVRKGIKFNHSETALKLRKHGPIGSNHNETALRSK